MARTTSRPSTATRRNTRTTRPDTNGHGSLDEQHQDSQLGDNGERREGLSAVPAEQNTDRHSSRDERENANSRDERGEVGDRREQQPATPAAGMETFAPVLEAWKQVFTSWSELTETMVKAQQDAFANMISGANAHAKNLSLGDDRNAERAFSGSPTTASTHETIDRDRR